MFKRSVSGIYRKAVKELEAVKKREDAERKKVAAEQAQAEREHALKMERLKKQQIAAEKESQMAEKVIGNFKELFEQ